MSLHDASVSILHYDVIMLGQNNSIPFHYANVIMLFFVYVCGQTCLVYVYVYMYICGN